jgi:hypothetical protein
LRCQVTDVAALLAEIHGVSEELIAQRTKENLKRIPGAAMTKEGLGLERSGWQPSFPLCNLTGDRVDCLAAQTAGIFAVFLNQRIAA